MQRPNNPARKQHRNSKGAAHQGNLYPHGWKNRRHPEKITEASERKTARAARTNTQQVRELDLRLGVGQGAARERARLAE